MRYIFYIAIKYFAALRKQNLVNLITIISMSGVMFGTMAMIVVLSVFNGFDQLVQNLFKNIDSDFQVELKEGHLFNIDDTILYKIQSINGVNSISKVLEHKMLAKYKDYQSVVGVKGVDENFLKVNKINDEIFIGKYFSEQDKFVIVTNSVFNMLSLKLLDFENPLQLSFFKSNNNLLTMNNIVTNSFYLSGVFSGQAKLGSGDIILGLKDLQKFTENENKISALNISIKNKHYDSIQKKLQIVLGERFIVKNRFEQRPFVNKMIKSEKLIVYIIFSFILIVSMLSLVASLIVLLMQKQRDIQILFSFGFRIQNVKKIFLTVGFMITTCGLIAGTTLGLIFCFLQDKFHIVKLSSLNNITLNYYPIKVHLDDIISIQLIVIFLGLVTTYFVTFNSRFYKI
ncbi:MAG: ABC transporter permease [Flavobacteriales bacterium TMED191]|nr:MAG: ABC transporter permease [Flavobacteriales bacterium TMED191]